MQNCVAVGRVVKPIEKKKTKGKVEVGVMTIAIDGRYNPELKKRATTFLNVTVFGNQVIQLEKYFPKGKSITFKFYIEDYNYTNKEGQKVFSKNFVMTEFEFTVQDSKSIQEEKLAGEDIADELLGNAGASSNDFINVGNDEPEELPFS